jgi:hypothetical protein
VRVLFIRIFVGLGASFLLLHFFYPDAGIERTIGLAGLLVGLAYAKEALGAKYRDKPPEG